MEVIIYSTSACSYCTKIKTLLKDNNIEYKEVIVGQDIEPQEFVELTGQMRVPVTIIDNVPIVGFKEAEIKQALKV